MPEPLNEVDLRDAPLGLERNTSLQTLNTLAVNANAAFYIKVESREQIEAAVNWALAQGLPILVLGGGSNLVLADDFPGLVLHLVSRGIHRLSDSSSADDVTGADSETEQVLLRIAAGENWNALVQHCLAQGWYGIENLISIPGSVGAAPIQNIGAYGVELSRVLVAVEGYEFGGPAAGSQGSAANGRWVRLDAAACELAYRDSVFKGRLRDRFVITDVELLLSSSSHAEPDCSYTGLADAVAARFSELREESEAEEASKRVKPSPEQLAETVAALRAAKLPDPNDIPNAGSFFKNPIVGKAQFEALLQEYPDMPHWAIPRTEAGSYKLAAAWLIDQCGWKGREAHGLVVHPRQALVLTNPNGLGGQAVLAMAKTLQEAVYQRFAVQLEIEPRVYPAPEHA